MLLAMGGLCLFNLEPGGLANCLCLCKPQGATNDHFWDFFEVFLKLVKFWGFLADLFLKLGKILFFWNAPSNGGSLLF